MATAPTAQRPAGPAPAAAVVVLTVGAASGTERQLVASWCAEHHPGAPCLAHDDPGLAGALQAAGDPEVLPVRVTWMPAVEADPDTAGADGAAGRPRPLDAFSLLRPRRPWGVLQPLVRRLGDDRTQITPGRPARLTELRERFEGEAGHHDDDAFSAFVARQAVLACDRAERLVLGDRYKVPRLVAEQIAASARFRERIAMLAEQLERPFEEVLEEGESCLNELATVQSSLGIDAYRRFMAPMHANAWTVEVDQAGLRGLKELNRKSALVFLPTHRSYVDSLVLQDALQQADLPRNHILGGDNMSFWPLGPLGRRAGVVWIRRKFGTDRVYKLAVREFLGHLVAKRFNLEWYIEGGRTRTGKLRPPKIGLLRYLTEAIEDDRSEDVALVPVAIVYDRLVEVGQMVAEQTGQKKQSEGLRWWGEYVRAQRTNVGKARVHIGTPFSLREALAANPEPGTRLEKVAFRICDGINAITPVTPTALVTFALLGSRDVALSVGQVRRLADPLLDYLERRGVPGPIAELRTVRGLRAGLDALTEAGVLSCYEGGTEPVWSIAPGRHHIAAFYRNGVIHHFVNRAIVEIAMQEAVRRPDEDAIEVAWDVALRLRDLLKFEFFFAEKDRFREQLQEELELLAPDWRTLLDADGGTRLLEQARPLVAHRALRSFFDGMLIVAERLAATDPRKAVERAAFIQECMDIGTQDLLQGRVHGPECVSRETFAAALDLAANRDLVDPGREAVHEARTAWLEEVRGVVAELDGFRAADDAMLEEVLDGPVG